jgi:uncharacterized membrane protein
MIAEKETPGRARPFGKPQNVLLLLGGIFGLLFVFLTPPALVGDEPNHFFRAYQISDGVIIGEKREHLSGGWIPKSVLLVNRKLVGDIEMKPQVKFDTRLISEFLYLPLSKDDKVFERFPNTVIYNPIPYAPQVVGILIGKLFDASPLVLIYLARIVNLLFFLILAYLAITTTPIHKWVFCLLCLTPTNVFQVASASADAFTYGICFLTIACFLSYALEEERKLKSVDIVKIFVLSVLAVLSKQAYVLLPLLFLMIPGWKFTSIRNRLISFLALMAVCIGSLGAWSAAVKPIFLPYRIDQPISPEEQLRFIMSAPFYYVWMVIREYTVNFWFYFKSFSGQLTWWDLYVPDFLPVVVFAVLIAFALLDKDSNYVLPRWSKAIFSVIFIGTAFIVATLLYMTWSPIRGSGIEGVQGRYFIPIAPLFFLLFYNKKVEWNLFDSYAHKLVYLTVIVSLLITANSVIWRYYV